MNSVNNVAYLVFRRLRLPLMILIVVYSINVLGYVLIPGEDPEGNRYRMTFFDAIYFVSFMGSTIGFGELPHTFNYAQRFWTLFAIYSTVISWLYSVGAVFAIFRDEAFLRLLRRNALRRRVLGLREPYYIVCGYGLAGKFVVHELVERGIHCLVIDDNAQRLEELDLENLAFDVPALCGDAAEHDTLMDAGLTRNNCLGVISVTKNDSTNLAVAICCKLIVPERRVISRCRSAEYARNLESFGTDHVIYPFNLFAEYLDMAIHTPYRHWVHDWLISSVHGDASNIRRLKRGKWILCGYGRFGKEIKARFDQYDDVSTVVIEPDPVRCKSIVRHNTQVIQATGTEAETLQEAGIEDAVGIIAGSWDDANNLSIIMTAVSLKPSLITVARQNKRTNEPVFRAANIDMIMQPSAVTANRILALIKAPLLVDFLTQLDNLGEANIETLANEFEALVGDDPLDSWSVSINREEAPALCRQLELDSAISVQTLYNHPNNVERSLRCRVLMIKRNHRRIVLPEPEFLLEKGDDVLMAGASPALSGIRWILENDHVLAGIRQHLNL